MEKMDLNFQLGYAIGFYIIETQLPTLSTDMKPGKVIVEVSAEDAARHELIDKVVDVKHKSGIQSDYLKAFDDFKKLNNELARKYLKEKLEVMIPCAHPTDIERFRRGINIALWDCDFSWYEADSDFFRMEDEDNLDDDEVWLYSTTVILTLKAD